MSSLATAVMVLQAKNYSGSGDWLDESGNSHDAANNGALFKAYSAIQYVYLPGTAANYLYTPDAAALDLLGDIWIAGKFALTDWTPGADTTLIAKWEDTSDERAYRLMVDTTGVLRLGWSTDGTAANVVEEDSTVAPTVTDGDALWVAGTLDVSTGIVKFYTGGSAATPTWVQLGTTVSGSGATSIGATTAVLEVGSDNTGTAQNLTGDVYNAHVENGYDEGVGTLVFDADLTDINAVTKPFATFTEASSQAATVTINRSTSGLVATAIDEAMWLLTTDDYLEVTDHADLDFLHTEAFTVLVAFRHDSNNSANAVLMGKKDGVANLAGYTLYMGTSDDIYIRIGDGDSGALDGLGIFGNKQTTYVAVGVRNTTDDDIEGFKDGVGSGSPATDTSETTHANAFPLRIGATSNAAGSYFEGQIIAVALWRSALTDAEVLTVSKELLNPDDEQRLFAPGLILNT